MCDQELELNKRNLVNFLFPMIIQLLEEIEKLITNLDNKTYQDRQVVKEEIRKGKSFHIHSVTPLTKEQIKNELRNNHLFMLISYIKYGLTQINHQTIGMDEMFEWLEKAQIDSYYFKGCCEFGSLNCSDLVRYIICLLGAMRLSLRLGYGKPEIYNNIFGFLAYHSLNLFELLGVSTTNELKPR